MEGEIKPESKWCMPTAILAMLCLLGIAPFELEIRSQTDTGSINAALFAWFWTFRLLDSEVGFFKYPAYLLLQKAYLMYFPHFAFLGILVLYRWGPVSRKNATYVGILSMAPGVIVLIVNLVLGILFPMSSIIAPVPIPIAPIIGLLALGKSEPSRSDDIWLTESRREA
jgi:hypothetical protein